MNTNAAGSHSHALPAAVDAALADIATLKQQVAALIASGQATTAALDALSAHLTALENAAAAPTVDYVSSIPELLAAIRSDDQDEIVLAPGTYRVSPAASQKPDSLWITTARTRPVRVVGSGVKLDGGNATYFGAVTFSGGAANQVWEGFEPVNGNPTSTGVVVFGGYPYPGPGPRNITLRGWRFGPSLVGRSDANQWHGVSPQDHAVYVGSSPLSAPTGIVIEDMVVDQPLDGRVPLFSAFNLGRQEEYNVDGLVIRHLTVNGTVTGWVTWAPTGYRTPVRNCLLEDATITGYKSTGVRVEGGFEGLTFRRVTTAKDPRYAGVGFYSSKGATPTGVTFDGCSFA